MTIRRLGSSPRTLALYARAAARALPGAARGADMPDLELVLDGVEVDAARLAAYAKVCGFALRDELPATYPHVLAFPLQMALMNDERFPFAAVGLVHVSNRIEQHRPLRLGEPLELYVRATAIEPHRRGRAFSILSEVRVGTEPVWLGASTMLRRGGGSGEREGGGAGEGGRDGAAAGAPEPPAAATWRLPGDLGRRYAAVSGDRNPIHLYGATAKLLGFPRAIAHGMWTKARCLAALEPRLPAAFAVDVEFRRPILLPASVTFGSVESEAGAVRFAVRDAARGTPHLDGVVHPRGGSTES
jgi:acyl dehydratase